MLVRLALAALSLHAVTAAPAPQGATTWYAVSTTPQGDTVSSPTHWYAVDTSSSTTPSSRTTSSSTVASSISSSASSTSSSAPASSTPIVSSKKGVGYNDEYLTRDLAISWAYNWKSRRGGELSEGVTYEPMLSQSAMNVTEGIDSWLTNMSPFYGQTNLVSAAVSNSPEAANLRWLQYFFGNCTQCEQETHAVALHWYSDSFNTSAFKTWFTNAYKLLQKPIWITEFGVQRFTSSSNVTQKQEFLEDVIPWMEAQPFIERYGTFRGRFVNDDGSLTALGRTYSETV
ncbi:hypothetical protein Rhopal_001545-T1 [Rhodotorula paludigena]|uniref:Asl1-like glycosyl hydrolase catalytic domain-containing protein n=1 Tax=Rhodotorula paludigena TaxID=86838 RepID=A0AAV5GH31_9BASI|nr:hypothetical protein Rhopal_001545-T1 [Rhodotorula paludigena]